jgi:hypothetical protein
MELGLGRAPYSSSIRSHVRPRLNIVALAADHPAVAQLLS